MTYHRAGSLLEEWLEAERLARQHTAGDAARACGLSPHAFARRGSCASTPRSATRRALAGYLRTTPEMVAVLARVPAEHGVKTFRSDPRTRGKRSLLGQRLRAEMLRRGQTMAEVATEMGVSLYSLRYSVSFGARKPFRGTLSKVARYLGIDAATVAAWHALPAEDLLPVKTWVGWKLHPTVRPQTESGANATCERCVFYAGCRADVMRGDFAWCEEVTDRDFDVGEPEAEREVLYV